MSSYLRSSIHTALFSAALVGAGVASAAEAQQTASVEEMEIVVVTGSYIERAAEDAALPIDVLRAEDLARQGSPSMVELVKSIPSVQGVVGEANQYTAGGTSGTANINLRGLGGARTLVLLNGRRVAPSTVGVIGYDVNLLPPLAAIGRVEVLKDGAAATYGSDAVAGVVNFITKSDFEGLSLEGSYDYIEDTDGNYTASAVYGFKGESWDMLVAGGYRKRSALSTRDREFFSQNVADNQQGGFSAAANPGTFSYADPNNPRAPYSFRDPACAQLGPVTATGACLYQFTAFNNLVEEEEQYQAYTELNVQLGESTQFHIDALYAAHDVPEELASASYAPQQGAMLGANGALSPPVFIVPRNNAGFATIAPLVRQGITDRDQLAAFDAARAFSVNGGLWRPFGNGGSPLTGGAKEDERFFEGVRLSTGLRGEVADIGWDVAVTYGENRAEINTFDIIVTRMAAALQGFGGPNCTSATAPGQGGCVWLNPFSSGVLRNPATGQANNLTFNANALNTAELANWLYGINGFEDTSTTLVGDLVLNGQLPLNLGAGDIGWAAGMQYRKEGLERDPNDLTDLTLNPCVTSVGTVLQAANSTGCLTAQGTQSGVFAFFGPIAPQDLDRTVKAAFGELNVPILENLSAQVAVRYETYGGNVGSTTNPKLSMRWQALDWFALRGSVGTTFRGPLQTQLITSNTTGLAFVPVAGGFRTFDLAGNPNLQPEEAFTFNVGMIVKAGGYSGTLDYWSYDFEKSLEQESGTEMVAAFFGTDARSPTVDQNCNTARFAGLQRRFTFANNQCAIANLIRVQTNVINGPDQQISGLDASLSYLFEDVLMGGDLLIGTDATYTLEYERDAAVVEGIVIQPAGDFAGIRGATGLLAGTVVELRGSMYLDFSTKRQGVRITSRYVDGVTDVTAGLATTATLAPASSRGVEVGSFLTHDVTYRLSLLQQTTLTASVINFTDRDPPFARLALFYDPFIANPLGRYFKLLVSKQL